MPAENKLVVKLVIVRHTPLTAMLPPNSIPQRTPLAAMVSFPDWAEVTLPTSSTIPVNTLTP
jgi:hypothetical protein